MGPTYKSLSKFLKQVPKDFLVLFSIMSLSLWIAPEARAVRPLDAAIAAVAGDEGRVGFRDGSFVSALFNRPLGLAVSDDGSSLFVADSGNNRIRIIHLDKNNEVTTLAGQDGSGKKDGPLTVARFNDPRGVLYLPGDRLVVNDFGNDLLRLVDLKAGTITTLAGGSPNPGLNPNPSLAPTGTAVPTPAPVPAAQLPMKGVRAMAYMPAANSIFLTQPGLGALKRLDLKTGLISTVMSNDTQIPHPAALWCQGNKIFVADQDLPKIQGMDWKDNAATNPVPVGPPSDKVLSLSLNDNILYALLQKTGVPAQRFFLDKHFSGFRSEDCNNKQVSIRNPWGDTVPQENLFPVHGESFLPSIGFVPDPSDGRKFYVSKPEFNMIVSFRDLFGYEWNPSEGDRNSNGLSAPEYPARKPKGTYRIIIVGDSRPGEVHDYPYNQDFHLKRPADSSSFPHNMTLCPQTEIELNLRAALDEVPLNYEVFNFGRQGNSLFWPTFDVPEVVKHNDVDLAIIFSPMADNKPYHYYYENPLTSDGIPKYPIDTEYSLKPSQERIPDGMPRKFYDYCKAHGLVETRKDIFYFDDKVLSIPELHDSVLEFYGKPLDVLNRKLSGMKTSEGKPVRLLLVLCPYTGRSWVQHFDGDIWIEACEKFHIPYLNLYPDMNALHLSYFPMTQDDSHFDPSGVAFFSNLIAYHLVHDKIIPWDNDSNK